MKNGKWHMENMQKNSMTRRGFLAGAAGLTAVANLTGNASSQKALTLYVGTYTSGRSEGIYICRMDPETGNLNIQDTAKGIVNPSYLAIDRRRLYAVSEVNDVGGTPGGALVSYSIDKSTGGLTKINQQSTRGGSPCYVAIHPGGRFAAVANYGGGNLSVLPINKDGSLVAAVDVVQHGGTGGDPARQKGPHAHCVMFDRSGNRALAVDLGIDRVMIYSFSRGRLKPNAQPFYQTKPGAGPRHIDFHPSHKFVYLINELDSTISALAWNDRNGDLSEIQTLPTLPEGFSGTNYPADIHVHPNGRFVYGTNRGHNSLAAFAIDPSNGRMSLVGHTSTGGDFPRNFVIDPSGRFLLAANQKTDNIVVFRIDGRTGALEAAGIELKIPAPVCLKFGRR